ncbi:CLUMA_CG019715, isoform A [Clunio marinus]|uniref:CLUMA_CG019715, isoform A n=1 Tax=Clunio marinus TaxID=568069 RepID=A0A1J1J6R1_9DIPT|nr:CLUMA_CG019715, isoform A [Clunio marinus]
MKLEVFSTQQKLLKQRRKKCFKINFNSVMQPTLSCVVFYLRTVVSDVGGVRFMEISKSHSSLKCWLYMQNLTHFKTNTSIDLKTN